jgi:hypothetical protein
LCISIRPTITLICSDSWPTFTRKHRFVLGHQLSLVFFFFCFDLAEPASFPWICVQTSFPTECQNLLQADYAEYLGFGRVICWIIPHFHKKGKL